jgi:lipid-binding SYLF domain-containing protein
VACPRSEAASAPEIKAAVDATLRSFESQIAGARELAIKAAGILVFPSVVKAGIGIGGEYGEGLLIFVGDLVGTSTSSPPHSACNSVCKLDS